VVFQPSRAFPARLPAAAAPGYEESFVFRIALPAAIGLICWATPALFSEVCAEDAARRLDSVAVVGTRLPRHSWEAALPVQVYTAEELRSRGFSALDQFLRALSASNGVTLEQNDDSGAARAASTVSLRGLGPNRTLILIDGQRQPIYPAASTDSVNFVDTGTLPLAAIERIEVLPLGSSAIYGSDAVGGVINIVLRRDIDVVRAEIRREWTEHGGAGKLAYDASGGFDTRAGRSLLTVEYQARDHLYSRQRDYAAGLGPYGTGYYSGSGAYVLDASRIFHASRDNNPASAEACTALIGPLGAWAPNGRTQCLYSHYAERDLAPAFDRRALTWRQMKDFDGGWQAFGDLYYIDRHTDEAHPPKRIGSYLYRDPATGALSLDDVPGGELFRVRRALVELGPQHFKHDDRKGWLSGGARGGWGEVDLEIIGSLGRNRLDQRADQVVTERLLSRISMDPGQASDDRWYPLTRMPDAVAADLRGESWQRAQSSLRQLQAVGRGRFDLGWLPVRYALTGEYVRESYRDEKDPLTRSGGFLDYISVAGGGSRERGALAAELAGPVLANGELSLALRYDDYHDGSDVEGAPSWQIGWSQRMAEVWRLRGSFGRSFRAPDLDRLYRGESRQFSTTTFPLDPGDPGRQYGYALLTSGNLQLREERGDYWNLGLAWEPSGEFAVSVDLWSIRLTDAVFTEDVERILANRRYDFTGRARSCSEFTGLGFVTGMMPNADGVLELGLVCVRQGSINAAERYSAGVDFAGRFGHELGEYGRLQGRVEATRMRRSRFRFHPDEPEYDQLRSGFWSRWKGNAALDWTLGRFGANLTYYYSGTAAGEYQDMNAGFRLTRGKIDPYGRLNLALTWLPSERHEWRLGVTNVGDREPPFFLPDDALRYDLWPYYNRSRYDPFGRGYYASYRRLF
jgi:iron complex outermembrane recepter protein